jgi:putative nucleotidyltransferase with HDIG domain
MTLQDVSVLLVLPGVLFLLAAILLSRRINRIIPATMKWKWRAMTGLMVFFLAGYIFFMVVQATGISFPLEMVTSAIFLGGALFVFLVITLTRSTILQVTASEQQVTEINQTLLVNNVELEREIVARRQAENQAGARLRELETLHTIDLLITSSLDLDVTMRVFLEEIVPRLAVDAVAVLLLNRPLQTLEYKAAQGFRTQAIRQVREQLGAGSAGVAALERRLINIPDLLHSASGFVRQSVIQDEGFVSYIAVPLVAKGQVQGVLEIYHRAMLEKDEEWFGFLDAIAVQAALAIDNAALFNELQDTNAELVLAYDTTIAGWARALELRDKETEGHTQRVATMTTRLAETLGMKSAELVNARRGAMLHDIGKMGISDSILLKDGPLTEAEQEAMRHHPTYAFEMLSPIAYLRPALDIPYCHHEKWDGTGYPRGLRGKSIPLAARIFTMADVWDAIISERRYHPAWSKDKAIEYIRSRAGTHFDPDLVEPFLAVVAQED